VEEEENNEISILDQRPKRDAGHPGKN